MHLFQQLPHERFPDSFINLEIGADDFRVQLCYMKLFAKMLNRIFCHLHKHLPFSRPQPRFIDVKLPTDKGDYRINGDIAAYFIV